MTGRTNAVVGGGGGDTKKYKLTNNTSDVVIIPIMDYLETGPGGSIMVEAGTLVLAAVPAKAEVYIEGLGDAGMNLGDYYGAYSMYMPNADATLTDI